MILYGDSAEIFWKDGWGFLQQLWKELLFPHICHVYIRRYEQVKQCKTVEKKLFASNLDKTDLDNKDQRLLGKTSHSQTAVDMTL